MIAVAVLKDRRNKHYQRNVQAEPIAGFGSVDGYDLIGVGGQWREYKTASMSMRFSESFCQGNYLQQGSKVVHKERQNVEHD